MTQKDKSEILFYLKELVTNYIEQDTYEPLKVIASKVRKKFPELYKKTAPAEGTISRYIHDIGYKPDKSAQKYIPLDFVILDKTEVEYFDNPLITIIKTSERNCSELKDNIMSYFKKDIIYIQEDITNNYGVLIIYSTKYNLGACLQEYLERHGNEYKELKNNLD